ncbi:GNAT family N-acetyltransferase [Paenibacillus mucilaginosus]|uniref:GCN5-related N-acetyltransferase n=1 Tax=Paenibacillus mucilaginosus (strain KNP414) TaxID=1036673 RepID=F8FKE7_PAEMK|nr:GNAT family N-acetyltransferase [Paenibacillus mucilaginosus]AEI45540.1 GCN5-related N-acetyltransferase [Paenibacillus mucilaginosus KNP414]MCG7215291.1 GNAT family N-acetyltransferase [Paenibacillus mucilaginosus]WDM26955.1 GNAT family N-acetyltransferase [Paenibacillus mucilaginosus]
MKYSIRRLRLPQDYPAIAELLGHAFSEPTTAENLALEDSKIPAHGNLSRDDQGRLTGHDRYRLVAVDDQDVPVAYGISWRAPWTAPGELNNLLIVSPDYRRQGAGQELYGRFEQWAYEVGASKINYEIREQSEDSLRFALARHYEIERHSFESVLELPGFDLERHHPALQRLTDQGLKVVTLADLPGEEAEARLYELYRETAFDIPGFSGDYFSRSEWRKWTLDLPGASPAQVFIALDGEMFAGVASLVHFEATSSMYHEYTAVRRAYRGKGIALALKIRTIQHALERGAAYMRTHNDSLNAPMLRINRDRLGFVAVPGMYKVVKRLPQGAQTPASV